MLCLNVFSCHCEFVQIASWWCSDTVCLLILISLELCRILQMKAKKKKKNTKMSSFYFTMNLTFVHSVIHSFGSVLLVRFVQFINVFMLLHFSNNIFAKWRRVATFPFWYSISILYNPLTLRQKITDEPKRIYIAVFYIRL